MNPSFIQSQYTNIQGSTKVILGMTSGNDLLALDGYNEIIYSYDDFTEFLSSSDQEILETAENEFDKLANQLTQELVAGKRLNKVSKIQA